MISKIAMVVFFAAFALGAIIASGILVIISEIAAGVAAIALVMNA